VEADLANESLGSESDVQDRGHALVSSRRVEGTPVFNRAGDKIGKIHSVMIGKQSGKVAYALLSFGSFLGMGAMVHPIPWQMLDYDAERDGYVVDLDRETLENAPTLQVDSADRPRERSDDELVYSYYGQLPWWGGAPY
jgi:hypothetical protein